MSRYLPSWRTGAGFYASAGPGREGYGSAGGLAYHVEAGARLLPQLLLGFDLTGLSTFGNAPYGGDAGVTIIDYDVVATLFPFVQGSFLRGGAGWAFPVAPPLHITLGLDWSRQFFGAADVTGSSIWMMRVGFGWY